MSLLKALRLTTVFGVILLASCGLEQSYVFASKTIASIYDQRSAITDEKLYDLAVDRKIIPEDADKHYFEAELRKKNSVTMWILTSRDDKVKIIDAVKALTLKNEGAVISRSASYYATEINGVVYNSILKGDIGPSDSKGIGVMLRTIAIMDGDFNNGSDKLELARTQLGSYFEQFKTDYPEKYKDLLRDTKESSQSITRR